MCNLSFDNLIVKLESDLLTFNHDLLLFALAKVLNFSKGCSQLDRLHADRDDAPDLHDRDSSAFGLRMTGGVSLAFHDSDFFLRQSIQLVHELVNLPVRRANLTLVQFAVTRFAPRGGETLVQL